MERVLLAAVQQYSGDAEQMFLAMLQLPAAQQLEPAASMRLVEAGYTNKLPLQLLQRLYKQVQTGQHGSAVIRGALRQLLLFSFEQQCWDVFDWLQSLPPVPADADVALCYMQTLFEQLLWRTSAARAQCVLCAPQPWLYSGAASGFVHWLST
jgi:hypothetical protein